MDARASESGAPACEQEAREIRMEVTFATTGKAYGRGAALVPTLLAWPGYGPLIALVAAQPGRSGSGGEDGVQDLEDAARAGEEGGVGTHGGRGEATQAAHVVDDEGEGDGHRSSHWSRGRYGDVEEKAPGLARPRQRSHLHDYPVAVLRRGQPGGRR
jgi:hypothetical protein